MIFGWDSDGERDNQDKVAMASIEIRPGVIMAYDEYCFAEPWTSPQTIVRGTWQRRIRAGMDLLGTVPRGPVSSHASGHAGFRPLRDSSGLSLAGR